MFFSRKVSGERYVSRGVAAARDFQAGDLTLNGAFHDLDLSSIIDAGSSLVMLHVTMRAAEADKEFVFLPTSNDSNYACYQAQTQVANIRRDLNVWVEPDDDGKIRYRGEAATWAEFSITVRGWII